LSRYSTDRAVRIHGSVSCTCSLRWVGAPVGSLSSHILRPETVNVIPLPFVNLKRLPLHNIALCSTELDLHSSPIVQNGTRRQHSGFLCCKNPARYPRRLFSQGIQCARIC